jgi:hypothetical protein
MHNSASRHDPVKVLEVRVFIRHTLSSAIGCRLGYKLRSLLSDVERNRCRYVAKRKRLQQTLAHLRYSD